MSNRNPAYDNNRSYYNSNANTRPRANQFSNQPSNNNQRRPPTANTISNNPPVSHDEPLPDTTTLGSCTYCQESGHDDSTCPHF